MPNEDGSYSKEEFEGLLGDKRNEVKTRQQAQADLANQKSENEKLNRRITEVENSTKKVAVGDPEDVMTRAEVNKLLKTQREEMTTEYTEAETAKSQKSTKVKVEASFEKAKEKYTEEKAGKGLTFDEVWEGTQRVIVKDKSFGKVIAESKNPGEKAYEIGRLHDPVIAKRVELNKKQFADPKRTPKVGMEGTEVPGNFFSQERVKTMTRAEIKANLPAIRESQKKWKK